MAAELKTRLRALTRSALDRHLYESAIFYADKLVGLSKGTPEGDGDYYLLAQAMCHTEQYIRALHHLKQNGCCDRSLDCRYLAALCLLKSNDVEACLEMLLDEPDELESRSSGESRAAVCVLRARAYEQQENRGRAARWYRAAVAADPHCVDAFEALIAREMLTVSEERALVASLSLGPDEAWIRTLFGARLKKYGRDLGAMEAELEALVPVIDLRHNLDVEFARADAALTRHAYNECFTRTTALLDVDPFHTNGLIARIVVLVELNRGQELFIHAHALSSAYPKSPLTWFAVAAYYLAIGNHDQARRFFAKATTLDGMFGPAWLGFGHSFAAQGEHDQAMAAYRTATRLFKGSHLPQLCIAIEYLQTSQLQLAEQFADSALAICADDPLVHNELGVIAYAKGDWPAAAAAFERALSLASAGTGEMAAAMEPTFFNLGHVLRKLKRFDAAIASYGQALALAPRSPSTYAALAFTYHLMGALDVAIEHYHKSLGLKPDDAFTAEMLRRALAEVFAPLPNKMVAERHLLATTVVPLL